MDCRYSLCAILNMLTLCHNALAFHTKLTFYRTRTFTAYVHFLYRTFRSSLPEGHVESSMEAGSVPAYMPMRQLKIHTAMYSHGMLLTAMEKDNAKDGDDLMCLFEDLAGRNAATAMPSSAATTTVFPSQAPSMREGICIPHGLTGLPSVNGKIQDIRESCMSVHCNTPSALQSLYAESATSAAAFASQDDSPHNDLLPYDSSSDPSECPPGPAQAIARAGQPNSTYNCVCSYVTLTGLTLESAFLGCVLDILSDSILDSSFSHPIPHSLLLYLYRHEFFFYLSTSLNHLSISLLIIQFRRV